MRQDELIIEGERVDLGKATVTLEYVNNILTDIDKISASHSYTINLPMTARNERIFDFVSIVGHKSSKVGTYMSAEYRRNGMGILRNAKAYVTSVEKGGISLCLIWEGLARVADWLAKGLTLQSLSYDGFLWTGQQSGFVDQSEVVQASYNTGVDSPQATPTPSVNVWHLFRKVMDGMGQPWDDQNDSDMLPSNKHLFLRDLFIPLCSRGGGKDAYAGGVFDTFRPVLWGSTGVNGELRMSKSFGKIEEGYNPTGAKFGQYWKVTKFGMVDISVDIVLTIVKGLEWGSSAKVYFYGERGSDTLVLLGSSDLVINGNEARGKFSVSLDCTDYDNLYIRFTSPSAIYFGEIAGRGEVRIVPTLKVAEVNGMYDVVNNLPDIKQVDLVKAVCHLGGYGIVTDAEGVLNFVPLDVFRDRVGRGEALDWTEKIVNYGSFPSSITYKMSGYAQRNWMRYKEDDNGEKVDADGCILVDDKTLDEEATLFTLPFAATRGSVIPQYKMNNSGELEDNKVVPRIMKRYDIALGSVHRLGLIFDDSLYFPTIINQKYSGLRELLEYPVVVKVFARLSEYDLNTLDWTRPVYLRQTGQNYVVSKVSTDSDSDVCEIILNQL